MQMRNLLVGLLVAVVLMLVLAACAGQLYQEPTVISVPTAEPFDADLDQIQTRSGYGTLCYREQGGAKFVCESGGEIELQNGATLDVQSGATFGGALTGDVTGDLIGDVTSTGTSTFVTMTVSGALTTASATITATAAAADLTASDDLVVGDDATITGTLTIVDGLTLDGNGMTIDSYVFTYTSPITISGVLTNVRLLYYQVP